MGRVAKLHHVPAGGVVQSHARALPLTSHDEVQAARAETQAYCGRVCQHAVADDAGADQRYVGDRLPCRAVVDCHAEPLNPAGFAHDGGHARPYQTHRNTYSASRQAMAVTSSVRFSRSIDGHRLVYRMHALHPARQRQHGYALGRDDVRVAAAAGGKRRRLQPHVKTGVGDGSDEVVVVRQLEPLVLEGPCDLHRPATLGRHPAHSRVHLGLERLDPITIERPALPRDLHRGRYHVGRRTTPHRAHVRGGFGVQPPDRERRDRFAGHLDRRDARFRLHARVCGLAEKRCFERVVRRAPRSRSRPACRRRRAPRTDRRRCRRPEGAWRPRARSPPAP